MNVFQRFVRVNRDLSIWLRTNVGFFSEENFYKVLRRVLNDNLRFDDQLRILEIGGADRPFLLRSEHYEYHGLDIIDATACKDKYDRFYAQSVEQGLLPHAYRLIFSVSVIEHIKNNKLFFQTVYDGLQDNGKTIHYFSCKNHPFSLVTRAVGHKWQNLLIRHLRPEFSEITGYKTYYNKCSKAEMEQLLTDLGYKNIQIICFFGAADYFGFFIPLFILITIFNKTCRLFNLSSMVSGIILYAEK